MIKQLSARFAQVLLLGILVLVNWSCEKDEVRAIAGDGIGATVSASATTVDMSLENASQPAITFNWTPADFGYQAAISNTLQLGVKGDNFTTVKEVAMPAGAVSAAYTQQDFNVAVLGLNIPTGVATVIEARIKSSIGNEIAPVYSNVIDLTVTPYASTSYLYVPGAYQGWDPATAESLISPNSNGIYEGVILFTENNLEFKVTVGRSWENAYGSEEEGTIVLNKGDNIKAPGTGSYLVTVNTNTNTITFKEFVWGIIGDATVGGWDSDTDMYYNNAEQIWTITTELTAGTFKFRKDHDWGTNLGGSNGTLTAGGDNITVETAGTYTIILNVAENTYTINKQ